jgi:hypothetical protein
LLPPKPKAEMAARRASGWEDELRLARARWEAERGREDRLAGVDLAAEAVDLARAKAVQERALTIREKA